MFFGLYDLIIIPAFLFTLWAQSRVNGTFNKWSQYGTRIGISGAETARRILQSAGIYDVAVERVPGHLTDHYDPRTKTLRLSEATYDSRSVAALGVAAHEVGHAIQHDVGYLPLGMRSTLYPVASIGSGAGPWLAILGLFFRAPLMVDLGIILFSLAVLFYLITLPVEFNASSRALAALEGDGYLSADEMGGARSVLNAAALTYVGAAAVAISQLVRLLMLRNASRD